MKPIKTYMACLSVFAAAMASAPQAQAADAEISQALAPALMILDADKALLLGIATAGDKLVAVGGNGVIVTSRDGTNWKQAASPVDTTLTGVAFADARTGWAVGHDALILGTTDGGQTWAIQNFQPKLGSPLFAVQPLDDHRAIAVGAFGLLKKTTDGGKTWANIDAPDITADAYHLNGITRTEDGKLVVVGEGGLVGMSDDEGQTWRRLNSPYEGSFFGVVPWGPSGVIAYGMRGNAYVAAQLQGEGLAASADGTKEPADVAAVGEGGALAENVDWHQLDTGTTASFFGGRAMPGGGVILTGAESSILFVRAGEQVSLLNQSDHPAGKPAILTGVAVDRQGLVVIGDNGVTAVADAHAP